MTESTDLPLWRTQRRKGPERAFLEFHAANPDILKEIIEAAHRLQDAGLKSSGIDLIYGRMRWRAAIRTHGDTFKLNNNFRAFYARLAMHRDPALAEFFDLREQLSLEFPFDPSTVVP